MGFYTDDLIASRTEGIKVGKEEGIKVGKEEGIEVRAKRTAIAMLQDGEPNEKIIRYSGLSPEAIDQLRHEL